MDIQAVIDALKATTGAENQKNAADYLKEASKMIGFSQILFNLTTTEQLECAIRQAAVIYLKNLIHSYWLFKEDCALSLSDQDKVPLRQKIIQSIIQSPDAIRVHLCSCIQFMMRIDFPKNWPSLLDEILCLLHTSDGTQLHGCLLIIHKLCKIYEYKPQKDKNPLVDAMKQVLPLLNQRFVSLVNDNSQASCFLQKIILKIFYCLIQFSFNLKMISMEEFGSWLQLFLSVIVREIPPECEELNDSPDDTVYWKCKKWALKIIVRVFERYGSKGQVEEVYATFADYYSKEFAVSVINCIIKNVLEQYVQKNFVSSRVLHLAVTHLADAISHAQIWIIVKPHFEEILKRIIFPLLMHSEEDEQLWEEDIEEYLRFRYDTFEDLHNPSAAASQLLQVMARRAGVVLLTLEFILSQLQVSCLPHDVDASLHMIGVLAPKLIKNKKYKKDVEKLVHAHVVPRIAHEVRFVRARACYAAKCNSNAIYATPKILLQLLNALIERLAVPNEELPVKVEAAIAIAALLTDQGAKVLTIIKPHVRNVLMEVLRLMAQTQIDDLPRVIETLIDYFEEDFIPVAYDVAAELVSIFNHLMGLENSEENEMIEDYTVTVMGVLSTIKRVLTLIEDHEEIVKRVEPIVRSCIVSIFENFCGNYFDEGLLLTQTLIEVHVSPEMWEIYRLIYNCFKAEGTIFFTDCMPALHSYLTVDTENFLSVSERTQWLLEMCEQTLTEIGCGNEAQIYAAKLFEVFILQCPGRIDTFIPGILQLILNRMELDCEKDLRCQLLVVLIAIFYYNNELFIQTLTQLKPEVNFEWLVKEIFKNQNHFEGVHNRKMILFLMCKVMTLPSEHLPIDIQNNPKMLTEFCINNFDGLQKCIKAMAENRSSDDSSSESSSDDNEDRMMGELKDSDDDVDEGTREYLECIQQRNRKKANKEASGNGESGNIAVCAEISVDDEFDEFLSNSDDSEEYHHFVEEGELESYETLLDAEEGGLNIFLLFKDAFQSVQESNPMFFNALFSGLDEQKTNELQKLLTVCTQQHNLDQSKRVAQAGGYTFDALTAIPTNFKFT